MCVRRWSLPAALSPAATNISLLNDDERHRIGICYKQQGQQAAIELGHQLVTGKLREARMADWKQWASPTPERRAVLLSRRPAFPDRAAVAA
jgi:tRNA 2-selenouridine synthase SelU